MRLVSDDFLDAVKRSHDVVFRADALLEGQPLEGGLGLPVEGGGVEHDRRRLIRGVASFVVPGLEYVPIGTSDPLAPAGQEVRLWAGIRRAQGAVDELVSLGIYRIDTSRAADTGDVTVQVDAPDRAAAVTDASFLGPYVQAGDVEISIAVRTLIEDGVPGLEYAFTPTDFVTLPQVFAETDDRWQRAVELAASAGMELFFDGDGVCVMRPEPTLDADPVAELVEGADGLLIDADRTWTRVGRKNAVRLVTEHSTLTEPLVSFVVDRTPLSPTHWDTGTFGRQVDHVRSTLPATQEQNDAMARALLAGQVGLLTQVQGRAVPHFAIEASDVVLSRASRLGIDEINVVEARSLPLDPEGTMSFTTRARQVLTSGAVS